MQPQVQFDRILSICKLFSPIVFNSQGNLPHPGPIPTCSDIEIIALSLFQSLLIVDNLRIHHARIVKAWLKKYRGLVRVFYLPAYSPELKPDELVNSDLKIAIGQREPAQNRDELQLQMEEHMEKNKRNPEKMKRLFLKESVKYASHNEN